MDTAQHASIQLPRLNEPAPDFEAKTAHGMRKLADYKGKWLVLFSHPADFTPVCTTEFVAFAKAWPEFKKLNCELLGLSIDSTFAHIAWVRSIEQNFGVHVPFVRGSRRSIASWRSSRPSAPSPGAFAAAFRSLSRSRTARVFGSRRPSPSNGATELRVRTDPRRVDAHHRSTRGRR